MKCPYREIKETQTINLMGDKIVVKTDFAECYYSECPHYIPENNTGSFIIPHYCGRVKKG